MFKYILFFYLILCFPEQIRAAELHAILIADTDAENIGNATNITLNKFNHQLKKIASLTGLELKVSTFTGDKLKVTDIFHEIEKLSIGQDDVVVFFFNGHGFNKKKQNDIWPCMYFSKEHIGLEFSRVTEVILNKNPRLILSISDSCNNCVDYHIPIFKPSFLMMTLRMDSLLTPGYRKLFLESSGYLQVASAKTGDFSYTNLFKGAFFTNSFIAQIENEAFLGENANWNHILDETSKSLVSINQYPLYQLVIQ